MEQSPRPRVAEPQGVAVLEAIRERRGPVEVLRARLRTIADGALPTGVLIQRLGEVVHAIHGVEALHPEVHILPARQPAWPACIHTFAIEYDAGIGVNL